jgi:hypothetical protein
MMGELDAGRNGYVDLGEFAPSHARGRHELDADLLDVFDVDEFIRDARILVAELSNVSEDIDKGLRAEVALDVAGDQAVQLGVLTTSPRWSDPCVLAL